jgi:hypothetical protein
VPLRLMSHISNIDTEINLHSFFSPSVEYVIICWGDSCNSYGYLLNKRNLLE